LNPHATELNPHQAVPGGQSHEGGSNGAFRVGRSAIATTRVPVHDGLLPGLGIETPGQLPMGSQGSPSRYRVDIRGLGWYRPGSV